MCCYIYNSVAWVNYLVGKIITSINEKNKYSAEKLPKKKNQAYMLKEGLGFFFHLQLLLCELNLLSLDCIHNIRRKGFNSDIEYKTSDFLLTNLQYSWKF